MGRYYGRRRRYRVASYIRSGHGSSYNARVAESLGVLPLTRAVGEIAFQHGVTKAAAKSALKLLGPQEWHHTGLYARKTDFYDTRNKRIGGILRHINKLGGAAKFEKRRAALRAERARRRGLDAG